MANRKTKPETGMDVEHELPPAEDDGTPDLIITDEDIAEMPVTEATAPAPPSGETEKLRAERDVLLDRLARLQAEFDNARKRWQREQSEFREYALGEAMKSFLPVLDSFDLALKHESSGAEEMRKGLELMRRQLLDTMSRLGVEAVPAEGQPFDPRVHEAIATVETSETPENTVVEELQRGYKLKERLLRPAMVRVAHPPQE